MKLWSHSWHSGETIPDIHAAGKPDPQTVVTFSDNLNPHLAWDDVPEGTQSFALICHDFDVPSRGDDVNQPGREVPADLPRVEFFHWVLVDLPASLREIKAGEFSQGATSGGKNRANTLFGARQGINDFTSWFSGDVEMAGDYYGYDGPFPPFNDSLIHHYVFTLYALSVPRAPVEGRFTGQQVRQAIYPHILSAAMHSGTYTLNPRLRAAG